MDLCHGTCSRIFGKGHLCPICNTYFGKGQQIPYCIAANFHEMAREALRRNFRVSMPRNHTYHNLCMWNTGAWEYRTSRVISRTVSQWLLLLFSNCDLYYKGQLKLRPLTGSATEHAQSRVWVEFHVDHLSWQPKEQPKEQVTQLLLSRRLLKIGQQLWNIE